jgi:hypothetical protein
VPPPLQPGVVGPFPSMGCKVPQPFVAGGNRSYLEFWAVTDIPQYPGYITRTEGMRHVALHHTLMAGELVTLRAAVSSTPESALGCSPDDTFCVEVVGALVAKFQKLEERCSRFERPAVRIYDQLLGPPSGQNQLADHLDEDTVQLGVKLAAQWEVDAELQALWTSATRVRNLVLDNTDGSSSLAASMSTAVELLEG